MTRLAILTNEEQAEFDYPPTLSIETRAFCFAVPKEVEGKINLLRTSTNQVGTSDRFRPICQRTLGYS